MKYTYVKQKRDYARIDKLNKLNELDVFWDGVRKLTRRVRSERCFNRWQCLAEIREKELLENRIDYLEREKFLLEMKDRMNHEDFAKLHRLNGQIVGLKQRLKG